MRYKCELSKYSGNKAHPTLNAHISYKHQAQKHTRMYVQAQKHTYVRTSTKVHTRTYVQAQKHIHTSTKANNLRILIEVYIVIVDTFRLLNLPTPASSHPVGAKWLFWQQTLSERTKNAVNEHHRMTEPVRTYVRTYVH